MAEDTLIRVVEEREALRAEVARLREAFDISSAAHAQAEAVLATERAAHEATERSRQEATDRALGIAAKLDETVRALEATKAELAKEQRLTRFAQTQSRDELLARAEAAEARVAELERIHEQALNERDAAHAALDQARGLLGRVTGAVSDRLLGDIEDWLRANPATARPDAAAKGAELQIVECTDTPRGRAREKEAKG